MDYDELMGLVAAWKLELAKQVQTSREGATPDRDERGLGNKKADFLEGFYSALTCLERAVAAKRAED
jgi:hypothetical protein